MNVKKSQFVSSLLNSAGALAVLFVLAQPVHAQDADSAGEQADRGDVITVTASRVRRDGYSAPTPVTVFGPEDLARSGEINVFDAVNQLPSLAGSNSTSTFGTTQSTGSGGLSSLNLRGLGTNRTLTLLDGQRVVTAFNTGTTDAAAFPQDLVERVEIVTGGASASWGSDAVAGVVNYVLDRDYTGLKGNIRGGVSTYGDNEQGAISLTGGTPFADGRGHFLISGAYQDNAGVPRGIGGRDWYDGTRVVELSPAAVAPGAPQYVVAPRVVDYRLAPGGIITSGPLTGTAFGPGGAPYQFNYGPLIGGSLMAGGEQSGDIGNNSNLESALQRETLFARVSYDLTDSVNVHATFNHGGVHTKAHSYPGQFRTGTLTIQCDNAFLPEEIAQACVDNGITSFGFGTYTADLPDSVSVIDRTMNRFSVGADGTFPLGGREWSWSAYYTRGRTYTHNEVQNTILLNHMSLAMDAIRADDGAIVCRSELARDNGCVPFNIIGTGVASQAALDFVAGAPYLDTWLTQNAASISVTGDAFNLPAGPVSIVFGGEYRKEAFRQEADGPSVGNAGSPILFAGGRNYLVGNFQPAEGSFDVYEGFFEAVIPVFDTPALGKLEANGAVRATEYSTAGYVTTWKGGATWDTPVPGVRLRGVYSRDIRAPSLAELYRKPSSFTGTVTDPFNGGAESTANLSALANLNLSPEKGTTRQVGVVFRPEWLSGFSASVDYYNIRLEDAIGTIGSQNIVNQCYLGNTSLCQFVIRDGMDVITEVQNVPVNLASTETAGIDIETSFQMPASNIFAGLNGDFTLRALATHVMKYDDDTGLPDAIINDQVGEVGGGTIADWRLFAIQTYSTDNYSLSLTERWVSPGVINNDYIECQTDCPVSTVLNRTINDNSVDGAFYLDLAGRYQLTDPDDGGFQAEIYFKISNLLNLDPPVAPSVGSNPYLVRSTNSALHDLIGRYMRLGVRFEF